MSALKQLSLTLFLLLFSTLIEAQDINDFDLRSYRLIDFKLHRLEFNTRLQGESNRMSYNRHFAGTHLSPEVIDTLFHRNSWFRGYLSANYAQIMNSKRVQFQHNASVGLTYNHDNTIQPSDQISYYHRLNLGYTAEARIYFNNSLFAGINPTISVNQSRDKSTSEIPPRSWSIADQSIILSAPLAAGIGRIEQVGDAAIALHIIKELHNSGFIKDIPPDEIVLLMAEEISRLKNKRFFDSRERRIEELKVLDKFLSDYGLISGFEIEYAALLNDIWNSAPGQTRTSGLRIEAGIYNFYWKRKNSRVSTFKGLTTEIGPKIEIIYARPINLYWHSSSSIATMMLYTKGESTNTPMSPITRNGSALRTTAKASIDYLPDTRTSVSLVLTGEYISEKSDYLSERDPIIISMKKEMKGYNLISQLTIRYFFSERVAGSLGIQYNNQNMNGLASPLADGSAPPFSNTRAINLWGSMAIAIF